MARKRRKNPTAGWPADPTTDPMYPFKDLSPENPPATADTLPALPPKETTWGAVKARYRYRRQDKGE